MTIAPTHTFAVDLTNPGQFLACCGLLELANCLDAEAVGWFDDGGFHLRATAGDAATLVERFATCPALPASAGVPGDGSDEDADAEKSPPLMLGDPFDLRLDWWTDPTAVRAGFKTWSGGQTVTGFFDGMRRHVARLADDPTQLLVRAVGIAAPKPFYFDARLSSLTSIAMGFSAEKSDPTYSPAAEALSFVGLQRFRPETVRPREAYAYSTWAEPLPASVAAAVAHGVAPPLAAARFEFPFVVRTGGKYKAFGPATPRPRSTSHG